MRTYCLNYRTHTGYMGPKRIKVTNKIIRQAKCENCITMLSSKYAVCDSKKSRFMRKQKASGLLSILSRLGIKTSLSNIPLLGKSLFQ